MKRRQWTGKQKVPIVLEGLGGEEEVTTAGGCLSRFTWRLPHNSRGERAAHSGKISAKAGFAMTCAAKKFRGYNGRQREGGRLGQPSPTTGTLAGSTRHSGQSYRGVARTQRVDKKSLVKKRA